MASSLTSTTKRLFDRMKRGDAPKSPTDDLQRTEQRVKILEKVLKQCKKKLSSAQITSGSDTHKRRPKYTEYSVAQTFSELSSQLLTADPPFELASKVYDSCREAQEGLADAHLQLEISLEDQVLSPIQAAVEKDFPSVTRLSKQYEDTIKERDMVKNKLNTAHRQSMQPNSNAAQAQQKERQLSVDLEEAESKVQQSKDALMSDMYNLVSREPEFSQKVIDYMTLQAEYHERSLNIIHSLLPSLDSKINKHSASRVFGQPLHEHLEKTGRSIAVVIDKCICKMISIGLTEEGILRLTGASSKMKMLRSAFDANVVNMNDYSHDIHTIAGVLKQYLRELPEPLMTYELFEEWMSAASLQGDQRLQALWVVAHKLPVQNYENLRFLIKFLSRVAAESEQNKMSTSNLAIVIGPNVLWSSEDQGLNVFRTQVQSAIIESMIQHADWFFQEDVSFEESEPSPPSVAAEPVREKRHVRNASDVRSSVSDSSHSSSPSGSLSRDVDPRQIQLHSSDLRSSPNHFGTAKKKKAPAPPVKAKEAVEPLLANSRDEHHTPGIDNASFVDDLVELSSPEPTSEGSPGVMPAQSPLVPLSPLAACHQDTSPQTPPAATAASPPASMAASPPAATPPATSPPVRPERPTRPPPSIPARESSRDSKRQLSSSSSNNDHPAVPAKPPVSPKTSSEPAAPPSSPEAAVEPRARPSAPRPKPPPPPGEERENSDNEHTSF